ncbi:MAG: L,D-transpeptidase family protein [Deferribacteraceae bacterium]|jgi:murein L,D-transpeptidase YafK|nr:L,D-transpeptidase family protein [Deferribacteraceae bacterium]
MRKLLFVLSALITAHSLYAAEAAVPVAKKTAGNDIFIENVMSLGANEHFTIVVEKIPRTLYLLKIKGDSQEVIDNFSVLTGKNDGNKSLRGDERTPEGVYYTVSYMDQATMLRLWGDIAARYGTGAYPISYPNPIDRIRKKTGSGIWLHGLDPERQKPVTEGCVGIQNADLERIKPYMSIGMPAVIIDNASFMTKERYMVSRNEQIARLKSFISAWNSGDYNIFKSHVHPEYSSYAGVTAKAYLEKKRSLMSIYPEKSIEIDNVNIYKQSGYTLVYDFDQFYCAPNMVTFNNKRIYLENDNSTFKVISEEIRSKQNQLRPYMEPKIMQFLNEWKRAWESKDIEKYMAYYSSRFPGLKKWREIKEPVFTKPGRIRINIKDVKWNMLGGNRIQITFSQDYTSDSLTDRGNKRLIIAGCPGSYKIESEDWSTR